MRLKSAIWVAAYIRRCNLEGAFATLRRRGAEEAGAIGVKINRLNGTAELWRPAPLERTAELFGPAPQSVFDIARPRSRLFTASLTEQPASQAKVEDHIARESDF